MISRHWYKHINTYTQLTEAIYFYSKYGQVAEKLCITSHNMKLSLLILLYACVRVSVLTFSSGLQTLVP